jgi:hypothetical protein
MFRGFNLAISENIFNAQNFNRGRLKYSENSKNIKKSLDSFINTNGSLNGNKIQEYWFPSINSNIFISHSHKDENIAISLAGWLNEHFGLDTFIDSCVWGHADELLKQIDNNHCSFQSNGMTFYNYEKRNGSTSHVHMILSTALSKMIDNTECIIFLNTSNSINSNDTINKTSSPWIFSELAMIDIVRRKTKKYHRDEIESKKIVYFSENYQHRKLDIEYELNLTPLQDITFQALSQWFSLRTIYGSDSLDDLYKIVPERTKEKQFKHMAKYIGFMALGLGSSLTIGCTEIPVSNPKNEKAQYLQLRLGQ